MASIDLMPDSPGQLIVTNAGPNDNPNDSDQSSPSSQRSSLAAQNKMACPSPHKIKRRPVSAQTALYSPVNNNEHKPDDTISTPQTQYATTGKSLSHTVPTPLCSASCPCRHQQSPCKSPSLLVAASEDELQQERLARQTAESKQQELEAEIGRLRNDLEEIVSGGCRLEDLWKKSQGEVEDLELRIEDGDREIERLHGKLDEEYDKRVNRNRAMEQLAGANGVDRPTSKQPSRSDEQHPLMRRLKSKISMLNITDTSSQAQQIHELELQNSALRNEVHALEQAVDKWFFAFETEKSNYDAMKDRYIRETDFVRLWKASANQAMDSLENKQKAHNEDIRDHNRLVEALKARDQTIVGLESERDEMIVKLLEEKEETGRMLFKKEKWKGWAWRQKRLADGLWVRVQAGCKQCGSKESKEHLLAELRACSVSGQAGATAMPGDGVEGPAAGGDKQPSTPSGDKANRALIVRDEEGSLLESNVLSKVLGDDAGLDELHVLKEHAESS